MWDKVYKSVTDFSIDLVIRRIKDKTYVKLANSAFVIVILFCSFSVSAMTVTRIRDAIFNISVAELITGGAVQSLDQGSITVNVTTPTTTLAMNPALAPFLNTVTRAPFRNIFRANFTVNETPCNTAVSINTQVEDTLGNPNRLNNSLVPAAWIGVDYQLVERNRRCRGNGNLRRINYRGELVINNLLNAGAADNFTGVVTLTLSYP